jgi:hypothetical protein
MEKKSFSITTQQYEDVMSFSMLNQIVDVEGFVRKCFTTGFLIEKYGLLGEEDKVVEVIKEVEKPVEVIKYVDKIIKEVIEVETPVEVIKEVEKVVERVVEIPIEKIVYVTDDEKNNELLDKIVTLETEINGLKETKPSPTTDKEKLLSQTIQTLRQEIFDKNKQIKELEEKINELRNENKEAIYLRGSNLSNRL